MGTAADWLLRFLLHPTPSLALAAMGADLCGPGEAFTDIAASLGYVPYLTNESYRVGYSAVGFPFHRGEILLRERGSTVGGKPTT